MIRNILRYFFLILYYAFAQYLPSSYSAFGGKIYNSFRIFCVKHIFKYCGKISTMERRAYFGNGRNVKIGNGSGIGAYNCLPNNIIIGQNVMLASGVIILNENHAYDRVDIPICKQGYKIYPHVIIGDDCWICTNVIITPGRIVSKGSIVAAGAVLTKDYPEYSVVGGNPAKLIKNRK